MIDLYFAPTPNGQKPSIMLEETGLDYTCHLVNILQGDQFKPDFLAICPNGKIPAMIDQDGPGGEPLALFESGAMLIYLAEKTGQFLPSDPRQRMDVMQWLMFQMANVGPMFGQTHHFHNYAPEKLPYAMNRYRKETERLYKVMDDHLAKHEFLAADAYTIADIATWPWVAAHKAHLQNLDEVRHVKRWYEQIAARPAVQKGYQLMRDLIPKNISDDEKTLIFNLDKAKV